MKITNQLINLSKQRFKDLHTYTLREVCGKICLGIFKGHFYIGRVGIVRIEGQRRMDVTIIPSNLDSITVKNISQTDAGKVIPLRKKKFIDVALGADFFTNRDSEHVGILFKKTSENAVCFKKNDVPVEPITFLREEWVYVIDK